MARVSAFQADCYGFESHRPLHFLEILKNFEFLCQKSLFPGHLQISKLPSKKFFFLELLVFENSCEIRNFFFIRAYSSVG